MRLSLYVIKEGLQDTVAFQIKLLKRPFNK